jgi:hypothetical protein
VRLAALALACLDRGDRNGAVDALVAASRQKLAAAPAWFIILEV